MRQFNNLKGIMTYKNDNYEKLNEFRKLVKDWNGYEAEPINPEVIKTARDIVRTMPPEAQPEVFPLASGNIQLEWEKNGKYLEITLESNGEQRHKVVYGDSDMKGWWFEGWVYRNSTSIGTLVMRTIFNREYRIR